MIGTIPVAKYKVFLESEFNFLLRLIFCNKGNRTLDCSQKIRELFSGKHRVCCVYKILQKSFENP
jgi:hypothetical protein